MKRGKKLLLNKAIVSSLNINEANEIRGGATDNTLCNCPPDTGSQACPTGAGCAITNHCNSINCC